MVPRDHLRHLGAIAVLSGFVVIRWWAYVGSPAPLGDEGIYLRAFAEVLGGGSTDAVSGFYYPPIFAAAGAGILGVVGESATLTIFRTGAVLGLAVTVWISLSLWPVRWIWRLAAGCLYLGLAPAVYYGIETGNLTLLVSGAILSALVFWPLRPALSGLLMGGTVALKPLAPLTILSLFMHRPLPQTRRNWLAGGVAGIVAAVVLLSDPEYLATGAGAVDRLPFIRSISLNRILVLLHLEVSPAVVALLLGVIVVIVLRLVPMTRDEMLCFGGVAGVVAVPIIWSHTLLLTLPVQVLAMVRARDRRRQSRLQGKGEGSTNWESTWLRYEPLFVVLAVLALQLTGGAGAIDDQPVPFQLVILTGAYLAAPILMAYVLITSRDRASPAAGPEA